MDEDPLGSARGVATAVLIGAILWALIVLTYCWR